MDDKAARLRGAITFLLVCVLAIAGLLVFLVTRSPEPRRVATVAPAPVAPAPDAPAGPAPYVWDGNWNHLSIPAGVGSKSDITAISSNADVYTESGTGPGHPFTIECRREIPGSPGAFDAQPIPCGNHVFYFDLVNNTDEAQDALWHPGPIVSVATNRYWDGVTWNHVHIPAGIGAKSDIIPIEAGTRPQLLATTRNLYDFKCARQVESGYQFVECSNNDTNFYLVNKTEQPVDAEWHPGPY